MKLQKIEIRNFRGFPGTAVFTFELNGKNLLLYGENGSGKSTLFHAINEFFDLERRHLPFAKMKNLFSTDPGGEIALTFDDSPNSAIWNPLNDRPFGDPRVSQTALRTACLDYRAILQTSFAHRGDDVNLFDLLINYLLANFSVTVTGGTTKSIRSLWEDVQANIPTKNTSKQIQKIDELCDEFNSQINLHMPALQTEAERLLAYFPDCNIVLHLKPVNVFYNPDERKLDDQKILLEVDFNNKPITSHQYILNEARLSAIALSIYLASARISIPPDLPGTPASLKLLVLDDVVIGLDLSNRLPLLDILHKEFSDWQIILMTYDKVWFEMVRMRNPDWEADEIFSEPSLIPTHKKFSGGYLGRAKEHLSRNDDHAAAVYARAEFERLLKKYCEILGVRLPFKQAPSSPDSGEMLDGLENRLKDLPKWHNDPLWQETYIPMFLKLRAVRKVILNPLSHSQLITIAHGEIDEAINAIRDFKLLPRG